MNEVSLREYLDLRIKGVEEQINNLSLFIAQHFEMNEKATKKAEEAMQLRLEGIDKFRSQINMERANYATRGMLEKEAEIFNNRLKHLETNQAFSAGKLWMVMAAFAVVPTIIALIALFV